MLSYQTCPRQTESLWFYCGNTSVYEFQLKCNAPNIQLPFFSCCNLEPLPVFQDIRVGPADYLSIYLVFLLNVI